MLSLLIFTVLQCNGIHNFFLGDFHRKLPRTPSSGTMSSADDLDEREPPSPSEAGTNPSLVEPTNQLNLVAVHLTRYTMLYVS